MIFYDLFKKLALLIEAYLQIETWNNFYNPVK